MKLRNIITGKDIDLDYDEVIDYLVTELLEDSEHEENDQDNGTMTNSTTLLHHHHYLLKQIKKKNY